MTGLVGKRLIVDGVVRNEMIVNSKYGRPVSFNRYQHVVRVTKISQVVSVD